MVGYAWLCGAHGYLQIWAGWVAVQRVDGDSSKREGERAELWFWFRVDISREVRQMRGRRERGRETGSMAGK